MASRLAEEAQLLKEDEERQKEEEETKLAAEELKKQEEGAKLIFNLLSTKSTWSKMFYYMELYSENRD